MTSPLASFGPGLPRALLLSIVLAASASSANAALITYEFTGSVAEYAPSIDIVGGRFESFDAVSGSFVIDTSVADTESDSAYGFFPGALVSIDVTVDGYVASGVSGDAVVTNDVPFDGVVLGDANEVGPFSGNGGVSGDDVGDFELGLIVLYFIDFSTATNILSDDGLPSLSEIQGLAALSEAYGELGFYDPLSPDDAETVIFRFATVSLATAVPAPPALWLGALGLLWTLARRRA